MRDRQAKINVRRATVVSLMLLIAVSAIGIAVHAGTLSSSNSGLNGAGSKLKAIVSQGCLAYRTGPNQCTPSPPTFCAADSTGNGPTVDKASLCGCPSGEQPSGDSCRACLNPCVVNPCPSGYTCSLSSTDLCTATRSCYTSSSSSSSGGSSTSTSSSSTSTSSSTSSGGTTTQQPPPLPPGTSCQLSSGCPAPSSSGASGCFTPNTPVLMANGSEKPIADVKVGEYVLSFPDTAPTDGVRAGRVTRVFVHRNWTGYERLVLSDGKVLNVTDEHYLLTALGPKGSPVKDLFTNVSVLEPGDTIYTYDSATGWYDPVTIVSKTWVESHVPVYSLEVQSTHTFIADDVAAHNTQSVGGYGS